MTIPIGAILAGLGRGASELGDRMDRNEALRRQRAMDALNEAVTFRKMGARVLRPDETDTDAFVASPASQAVGRARTPDAIAALVNQGVQPDQNQTVTAQLPDPVTGATRNIFIDPTQSDDARAEQRAIRQLTMTQSLQGQREQALEAMRERSRHDEKLDDRRFDLDKLTRTEKFTAEQNEANRKNRLDATNLGLSGVAGVVQNTGPDGKPVNVGYTRSGKTITLGQAQPKTGAGTALSGIGQSFQARLLAAVSEGRLADQRMDAFTSKRMKDGKLDVGAFDQMRANTATNLAASKKPFDIFLQGMAESSANDNDPEYMQFMRDARLIARAEQLMAARGGSEAMSQENAFLARGGAHAPKSTVEAASKTRKALFGKMGAVMQTLSDEQKVKLAAGLEALMKDDPNFDYAGTGAAINGGGPGAAPSASGREWVDPKTGRRYRIGGD